MAPYRGSLPRGLEVGLRGDAVEPVVEEVADVGEELDQRDRRIGDRQVRLGITANEILDEGVAQRSPVACEVVVNRRRRRQRRLGRRLEAAPEVGALGKQTDGKPGPQRVEGDARRRIDAEEVPGEIGRPAELQLDVRRRVGLGRRSRDRHARASRRRLETPTSRVDEARRRIVVEPDPERALPGRDAGLRRAQPVHGRSRIEEASPDGGAAGSWAGGSSRQRPTRTSAVVRDRPPGEAGR